MNVLIIVAGITVLIVAAQSGVIQNGEIDIPKPNSYSWSEITVLIMAAENGVKAKEAKMLKVVEVASDGEQSDTQKTDACYDYMSKSWKGPCYVWQSPHALLHAEANKHYRDTAALL